MDEKQENKDKTVPKAYKRYLGMVYNVKKSFVVVAENIYTHKAVALKPGLSVLPFNTVKRVVKESNVATPGGFEKPLMARSKEGYDLGCLFSWVANIVDPIKFVYASENPGQIFDSIIMQGLKSYVNERNYEDLSQHFFDINASGAAQNLKKELKDFEDKYGIRISEIRLNDIIPPKELEEAYRAKAAQQSENEKRLSEAKTRAEEAKLEKQRLAELGKGQAMALKALQKANLTSQEAAQYDVEKSYADKTQTVYRFSGNTGEHISIVPPSNSEEIHKTR